MRVVVKVEPAPDGQAGHIAHCRTGTCNWTYHSIIKAAVEEQARWHRQKHRREATS